MGYPRSYTHKKAQHELIVRNQSPRVILGFLWKQSMVEEILGNLYKIEIPLPDNPLKAVNSYVIKSSERNLIVDTGWDRQECRRAMLSGLKELEIDPRKTDFFITHMHSDHLGLVSALAENNATIYFNKPDADWIESRTPWDHFLSFARLNGFPENELQAVFHSHPGFKYRPKEYPPFHILCENNIIRVSDYLFKCVETPGHTRGHMCLYEPNQKIFIAGDHILNDISPTLQLWSDDRNPLNEYLRSLEKVYELDIRLVLPGHRRIFGDCKDRIQELKHHHRERAEQVLSILDKGSKTAFQVASQMHWEIIYDSWDFFPISQKWFATGEAIAHLKYLEEEGMVKRKMEGPERVFSVD